MGKNLRKPALKRLPRRKGKGIDAAKFPSGTVRTPPAKTAAVTPVIRTDTKTSKTPVTRETIVKTQGVCGGNACIVGPRISVWILELERRLGMSERQLLERHPSISADLLREALRYADDNPEEIELQIASNEG